MRRYRNPLGWGRVPELLWFSLCLVVFLWFLEGFSYTPGPILDSVFLWHVSVDRNLPAYIYIHTKNGLESFGVVFVDL